MTGGEPRASRTVFCVSDHTGTTAETFAHSLMSRFDEIDTRYVTRPFIDTEDKVRSVVAEIDREASGGHRPIVFSTLTDPRLWGMLAESDGLVMELFEVFLDKLATELDREPSATVGRFHSIGDSAGYQLRLDAVDFALMTDDGLGTKHYDRADVILIGVSRVGKTPTCLYLSMHYGIRAANYPLTSDDLSPPRLPEALASYQPLLFGLTIDPTRLHQIRQKRRPDSPYSSLERCQAEVEAAERLFRAQRITSIDTTTRSIEEITATVIEHGGLPRRLD